MKILLTGSTGFIGQNLENYLNQHVLFKYDSRSKSNVIPNDIDVFIHLAGIAHDTQNTSTASDYYKVNTDLTKNIFDTFLNTNSKTFIFLSSVKAAADSLSQILTESFSPSPRTDYGKSKLLAEEYILKNNVHNKKIYILRPTMIHGPGNKGNLNLLYKIVKKGIPWPLGAFDNKRSFCSIENLCFIINELIENTKIQSGIYNIADDDAISTNQIIEIISSLQNKKIRILYIPKKIIYFISRLGNIFHFPLNTERLEKLTENYIVSNEKIKNAINKKLPISTESGLRKTIKSFNNQ